MTQQTPKVWARRVVTEQLQTLDESVLYLARLMTEESFKGKVPSPIKKRLQTLHKTLQENLIKIKEDWAITTQEQMDKNARKLNKDRRPTKQTEIKPIDFAKMEKRVAKKKVKPKPCQTLEHLAKKRMDQLQQTKDPNRSPLTAAKPKKVKKPVKKKVKKPTPKGGKNAQPRKKAP